MEDFVSVRWTGFIMPEYSEKYTFYVQATITTTSVTNNNNNKCYNNNDDDNDYNNTNNNKR